MRRHGRQSAPPYPHAARGEAKDGKVDCARRYVPLLRVRSRRVTWLSPASARKPFFPEDSARRGGRFLMISGGGDAMDVRAMLPLATSRAAAFTLTITAA